MSVVIQNFLLIYDQASMFIIEQELYHTAKNHKSSAICLKSCLPPFVNAFWVILLSLMWSNICGFFTSDNVYHVPNKMPVSSYLFAFSSLIWVQKKYMMSESLVSSRWLSNFRICSSKSSNSVMLHVLLLSPHMCAKSTPFMTAHIALGQLSAYYPFFAQL